MEHYLTRVELRGAIDWKDLNFLLAIFRHGDPGWVWNRLYFNWSTLDGPEDSPVNRAMRIFTDVKLPLLDG